MRWLADNSWLGWVGVAIVLAAIEAATVDFVFVMFAGGALAAAVAAALGATFPVQVVTAVVVAVLLLLGVRPLLRRHFLDGQYASTIGVPALVGRAAQVTEAVDAHGGRIKLGGEVWSARVAAGAAPCPVGTQVTVLEIQGATAVVAPLDR